MGCTNSKQSRCNHCKNPHHAAPVVPRSYSMQVHHLPQSIGDSYHVVALTSSTLGSLDQLSNKISCNNSFKRTNVNDIDRFNFENEISIQNHEEEEDKSDDLFSKELLIKAKSWSNMIEEKIPKKANNPPKTPTTTPPCEPETINTWELMEGLEDTTSPLRSPNHFKSFSFDVNFKSPFDANSTKPLWLLIAQEELNLKPSVSDSDAPQKKMCDDDVVKDFKDTPFGKNKVVLYFTSLRGIRKTYEDCCNVRLILRGLGVKVDERDVSMHSGFKEELKELLLGHGLSKGRLPRVFIGRNYIGGYEEIQKLHEEGKLGKLFECCEKIDENGKGDHDVCEACGDVRFVPCETCNGSCKIYYEEDEEDGEFGFKRCPDCNENGLIRCHLCCY